MINTSNSSSTNFNELFETSNLYISNDGISESYNETPDDFSLSKIREKVESLNPNIKNEFNLEIYDALANNSFETGVESNADVVFRKFHDRAGIIAVDFLVELFLNNINSFDIVIGLIRILSHQTFENVGNQGKMLLIIALTKYKNDPQIQDTVIRTVENWEQPSVLDILDNIDSDFNWVIDYKNIVKEDLETLWRTL